MRSVNRIAGVPAVDVDAGKDVDLARPGLELQASPLAVAPLQIEEKPLQATHALQLILRGERLHAQELDGRNLPRKLLRQGKQLVGVGLGQRHGVTHRSVTKFRSSASFSPHLPPSDPQPAPLVTKPPAHRVALRTVRP
jgi:hypothetical protein